MSNGSLDGRVGFQRGSVEVLKRREAYADSSCSTSSRSNIVCSRAGGAVRWSESSSFGRQRWQCYRTIPSAAESSWWSNFEWVRWTRISRLG